MSEITIRELTRAPAAYIDRVIAGERIALTRHGRVVAELVPYVPRRIPKSKEY